MTAEEKRLREVRRKNLEYMLTVEATTPTTLARKMACDASYVSQLRNGHRPITFDVARQLEGAAQQLRMSLDSPIDATLVSPVTDNDLERVITSVVKDLCKAHNKPTRGDIFDAMVKLCLADARARGYSEGRVQYIVGEFLK